MAEKNFTSVQIQAVHELHAKPGHPWASKHTAKKWQQCAECKNIIASKHYTIDGKKY